MNPEKPEIQELSCIEDLELLVQRDVILINHLGNGKAYEAVYWGKNAKNNTFGFMFRSGNYTIKRIVADKQYMELSKDGSLIVKPITETTSWKYDETYEFLDNILEKVGI
jgi:hypothetical protein